MDDWWLCQAAGRVGLVPANYLLEVQPIPAVLAEDSIDGVEEHIYDHIPAEKNDILERRHSDNLSPFHRKEGEGLYDVPRRNLSSSALGLNAITLVGNRSQSPTLQDPLYDRPRAYSSDQVEPLTTTRRATRLSTKFLPLLCYRMVYTTFPGRTRLPVPWTTGILVRKESPSSL